MLCSNHKEKAKSSVNPDNTVYQSAVDTSKTNTGSSAKIDTPLVTFIELGSVNCIPCKMMQPVMKQIEEEYKGSVKVVFYDVWTEKGKPYADTFKIRVIPTQVFLDKNGNEYFRHEGFFPKQELIKILKQKGVK
ncbi:thioredoxin family protein [bacterium]|nr:thioredoxin family protein [bacterium]